jgi:uncharacterized protein YceH (UPF0502 family)
MPVPDLGVEECRVLGCLVEKERTTPQQYPLSLNALTLACNQSTNRDPVVAYDEAQVQDAVTSLKTRGLVRFVHPSHGRSALRFRHVLDEELRLDPGERSVLAVLLLRGPQTPGELRARTERLAEFDGVDAVESVLEHLGGRPEPLVRRLDRQPGQKEERYAHLLGAEDADDVRFSSLDWPPPARPDPAITPTTLSAATAELDPGLAGPSVTELAAEVQALRDELEALRRDVSELRRELGA